MFVVVGSAIVGIVIMLFLSCLVLVLSYEDEKVLPPPPPPPSDLSDSELEHYEMVEKSLEGRVERKLRRQEEKLRKERLKVLKKKINEREDIHRDSTIQQYKKQQEGGIGSSEEHHIGGITKPLHAEKRDLLKELRGGKALTVNTSQGIAVRPQPMEGVGNLERQRQLQELLKRKKKELDQYKREGLRFNFNGNQQSFLGRLKPTRLDKDVQEVLNRREIALHHRRLLVEERRKLKELI